MFPFPETPDVYLYIIRQLIKKKKNGDQRGNMAFKKKAENIQRESQHTPVNKFGKVSQSPECCLIFALMHMQMCVLAHVWAQANLSRCSFAWQLIGHLCNTRVDLSTSSLGIDVLFFNL